MRPIAFVVMLTSLGAGSLGTLAASAAAQLPAGATVVPTRYSEGRWIARPVGASGDTLDLYTDSGGGFVFVVRDRLPAGAPLTPSEALPNGDTSYTTAWPAFAGLPEPRGRSAAKTFTARADAFAAMMNGAPPAHDGFLGNGWFADRVWRFDYPAHTLALLPDGSAPRSLGGTTVPLAFRGDDARAPQRMGRVRVAVDGDSLDLLFDTGATTLLTDSATAAIGDGRPASRAASFITRSVFDRWHARHPDWRVVPRAEVGSGADMIEVPAIEAGGVRSGPVWFTARADRNFHQYMAQWTDRPLDGALGGSGLMYYRVTADYPHSRVTFER